MRERRLLAVGLGVSLLLNAALIIIPLHYASGRGGLRYLLTRLGVIEPGVDRRYEEAVELYSKLPARRAAVVMLGDSITAQGPWDELLAGHDVLNRGIAGETVAGALARVDEVVVHQPRVLMVLLGVNDLLHERAVADIAADYERLVRALKSGLPVSTSIVVQSVLPLNGAVEHPQRDSVLAHVGPLNRRLQEIATDHNCRWLDLRPHFAGADGRAKPGLMVDFVHLSADGYLLWASRLKEALR